MRRKRLSRLANDILWSAVFVAQRVLNLCMPQNKRSQRQRKRENNRRDDEECRSTTGNEERELRGQNLRAY
jgi:hypothetical protein